MDLTRLYNLTTPELRAEAERLGVSDTYAMSRGQLIHAIRNQAGGAPPEGLLGKVLGFAKWALQPRKEPGETSAGSEVAPAIPMPSLETSPEQATPAESVPASVPESVPESVPASASVPASVGASDPSPSAAAGAPASALAPTAPADADPGATQSGPPSRPPVGVFTQSASLFEEPFPTLTMARILAEQGHFKRSLAIYAGLIKGEPENRQLRLEADGVRARARARRPQVH